MSSYNTLNLFINKLTKDKLVQFLLKLQETQYISNEDYETIDDEWKIIYENFCFEEILYSLTLLPNEEICELEIDKIINYSDFSDYT